MLNVVTAVVPVHNHEKWCLDAIESVVNQDFPGVRVVVVDDGSTDGSLDAVLEAHCPEEVPSSDGSYKQFIGHADKLPLIVLSFKQARGPSFARNAGMKAGWEGSTHFAFLDSDDLYSPDKISRSMEEFDGSLLVGAVYSDFETLNPDGLRLRQFKPSYDRALLLTECHVNCDSLVSARAIEKCGGFDESLRTCEDYDLWLRISEHFIISHVPEPLVTVRVGPHSSTSTVPSETWRACYSRAFEKLAERNSK